ncbi:MAG: DEAD/DEAH box helicase family protein, partial [Candidatus Thiodiazotropha sp.]
VHSYDTPIVVKGNRSLIRIVVRESTDGRRYYDHFEVRNEESPAPGEPKKDSDQEVSGASNRQSPAGVGSVTHKSQEDGEPATGSGRNSKKTNKINKETSLISIAEISDEDFETLIDSLTQAEIPQAETNKPRAVKTKKRTIKKRTPAQKKREAAAILKKVRAQGVKGADEALTGLAELFGGKGKLSSGFTFDEETYAKAKPHFKAALESFVETGKSLAEFIKFIVDNFGTGVKPYLIQFHKDMKADKIKIRGIHNDADSRADQAGDSAESADQERSNQKDATDADNDAGRAAGDAAVEPGEAGLDPQSDLSLHQSEPAVSGEPSNAGVPETEGRPGTAGAPAESGDAGRAADAGAARIPDGAEGSGRPEEDADAYRRSVVEKLKLQKAANKIPLTYGDPANVRDTLPFLLPEQQDDVMFAERRFLSGKEPGVLFTNGTGTGKTYTALGIIKRHMRDTGSNDVLIVVPAGKVNDWIEDARNLQISAAKLESKKDAGQDVTVTSYQNFQDNWELQARDFSLIVYDESHYLGQSAVGETMAYVMHRAAANHDDGLYWKAWIRDPKAKELEYARRNFIDNEVKRLESLAVDQKAGKDEREDAADNVANKEKLRKRLDKEFRERHQGEYHKIHDRARDQQEPLKEKYHHSNRVLFLSASPFAYHRSIDYAEGYLFSYSQEEERQGYYTITPRDQFFISNFGYRFRYGRLTTPDKDVDVSLMERRFNEQLKREGAVSGRMLEVDYDYSREFVIFNSELGEKVDRGLNVLRGLSPDGEYLNKEEMEVAGHPVFEELPNILRKKFTYSYLSQLTEAIKAENLTDRIHKHLGMGRKVVVFHDFQKTVDSHPFRFNDTPVPARNDPGQQIALAEKIRAEIDAFNSHYPELGKLRLDKLKSVVETISDTFGDRVAVIKGGVSANKKTALIKKYQANDSAIDVIVVQRQSGREGISLHDITGTHQRALIDMGLPIRPVDSLQTEGRVYRFAVKSDAVIEYPVLGTTFERIMFANKVAERSRTAENLAMGNLARDMERAFKEGYVDASDFDPHAKQGRGGKERDRTRREDDPFDIAKTLYFGRRKNTKRRDHREGLDYFSTPEPLGLKMVEWAGARPGERGLEPSAGHGAIARWFPEETRNVFVEPSARLAGEVGLLSNGAAEISTFEDLPVESKYDFVVMNPPFGSGGATAIKHIDKAMRHLKNGGRIVALIPEGPAANKKLEALLYGKARELEKLKEAYKNGLITGGERDSRLRQLQNFHVMADIGLPSVTFERAGTQVKTHILVIDRYDNPEDVPSRKGRVDLNHKDINELFEAIQYMEGPRRGVVSEPEKTGQVELETKKPEHAGVVKAKGFHTKKQKDIWYVHLTGPRIARDDFLVMKDKAKDLDGYYSAWKGNGAKPGFIFNTEEDANKFMDEYASYFGGETLYSRGGQQTAAPLSYGLLSDVVDNLVDQFAHQPPIRIIERVEDVHAAPLTEGDTSIICGFVRDGRIHLVRSAIPDAATASNTLWHELLHYGLRRFLTRDQYISDMHDLYSRDAWIKQYADRWVSGKGGEDLRRKGRSSDYIKAVGVDEALATLGEAVGGTTSGFQKTGKKAKAIRAVVRWLSGIAERLGFKNVAAWLRGITNEEARLYVHAIYGKLAADATATVDDWAFTADPAFMVRRRRGANDRASDEL